MLLPYIYYIYYLCVAYPVWDSKGLCSSEQSGSTIHWGAPGPDTLRGTTQRQGAKTQHDTMCQGAAALNVKIEACPHPGTLQRVQGPSMSLPMWKAGYSSSLIAMSASERPVAAWKDPLILFQNCHPSITKESGPTRPCLLHHDLSRLGASQPFEIRCISAYQI